MQYLYMYMLSGQPLKTNFCKLYNQFGPLWYQSAASRTLYMQYLYMYMLSGQPLKINFCRL